MTFAGEVEPTTLPITTSEPSTVEDVKLTIEQSTLAITERATEQTSVYQTQSPKKKPCKPPHRTHRPSMKTH